MASEKWVAGSGVGLTWTTLDTTSLNSLGAGNALQSGTQIANDTPLDLFADVELYLASLAAVAPNYVGIYLYPLLSDGTNYGDTRFTSAAAGPPPSTYWVGNIVYDPSTGIKQGMLRGVILPPGKFKFVVYNQMGSSVTFASSGNILKYRTYNRQVV
jgi:hypothetical protein